MANTQYFDGGDWFWSLRSDARTSVFYIVRSEAVVIPDEYLNRDALERCKETFMDMYSEQYPDDIDMLITDPYETQDFFRTFLGIQIF